VCQIDSITQAWGVLTAAAEPERGRKAMQSVVDRLVRQEERLILLLAPPFDDGPLDPGYIKAYPPGIRENGGQYTHAATWVVRATAKLGQGDLAFDLFQSLNPVLHSSNQKRVTSYKVEPYAVAGDVCSLPPHVGRGGWTWYTGAAGWLYRVGLESIIGLHRSGDFLRLNPCFPRAWKTCQIAYRFRSTTYAILFENPLGLEGGVIEVWLDGRLCQPPTIPLVDDQHDHRVRVLLGNV
jgi:cellobiose phosphorylase